MTYKKTDLIIFNIKNEWKKSCSVCGLYLDVLNFVKDKTKICWYYSSCKDCKRNRIGSEKMVPAKKHNCDRCWVEFKPKVNQLNNKTIYCSRKCEMEYFLEHRTTPYHWYRKYILERDNNRCVISWDTQSLDIHHIKTVGSGWTNEYSNLITLSRRVHTTLAHWIESSKYKKIFLQHTSKFERPSFWDEIMEKSKWDKERRKISNKKRSKKRYDSYIEKFKETHEWLTPSQYSYRKQKEYKDSLKK